MAAHRRPGGFASIAALALLALAVSCGGSAPGPAESAADALVALRARTDVVLPAELPPEVRQIDAVTGEGLPLVSFYSANQPLVTVCTGAADECAAVTDPLRTIRRGNAGAAAVLVTVDRPEDPADARPLSPELRAFWADVPLVTAAPPWLEDAA